MEEFDKHLKKVCQELNKEYSTRHVYAGTDIQYIKSAWELIHSTQNAN
jgi:hypothetical protein